MKIICNKELPMHIEGGIWGITNEKGKSLILINVLEGLKWSREIHGSIRIHENENFSFMFLGKEKSNEEESVIGLFLSKDPYSVLKGTEIYSSSSEGKYDGYGKFGVYKVGTILEMMDDNDPLFYLLTSQGWEEIPTYELYEGPLIIF